MISLIVPAYNEEAIIEQMLAVLCQRVQLDEACEILVVDDGSTDATPRLLAAMQQQLPNLRVVTHEQNQGLGCALMTGFTHARGRIAVTMDADLSHPPEMIGSLVRACDAVDFVVASRFVPGGGMAGVPWWRQVLSAIANRGFSLLFATRLHDITAGFKAYRTEMVRRLELKSHGFEVQLEITVRLLKAKARFCELPYILRNRESGSSKMRYFRLIPIYIRTLCALLFFFWLQKNPLVAVEQNVESP